MWRDCLMFHEGYEEFSDTQLKILEKYVTNTSGNVFVLRNLPEVIKGALFSRYSRSTLGLRSLLLKEFILNEETEFNTITGIPYSDGEDSLGQMAAIKKAQSFYDRILDGYGDDSIGELGGAHLALENVSMLAAKIIEDSRIGGSPLEKSTRYIYFDQKINGEYLFYREPVLMTSAYRDLYLDTCNMLFEAYGKLIPHLTSYMEERFPKEEGGPRAAYKTALRAKVLDCLRGLLPASALTNMGVYGNGRFFEQLIHKLHCNNLAEMQEVGKKSYEELSKIIPSFIRRSELGHRNQESYHKFYEHIQGEVKLVSEKNCNEETIRESSFPVRMIDFDPDSVFKVAAGILFSNSNKGLPELIEHVKTLPEEEIARILDSVSVPRENRRHKSPRALELATFSFEVLADFGVYRDLQRHRMFSQERQVLTCDYGYYIPEEILGTDMEKVYRSAMDEAKKAYDAICCELPEEAQYIVPMAYNIRWYFSGNLRALQWMCELRSSAAGHPGYRYIAQEMAQQVCKKFPLFERFFKFVDYAGYDLGRLGQEERKHKKTLEARGVED